LFSKKNKTLFMEINKDLKVEVAKTFSVDVPTLYDAWTNPEQLKQWWRPMGNPLTEVTNDLKEGGTVRYEFQNAKLVITGKYEQVAENEKLVYTWNWELPNDAVRNAAYKLTVKFNSNGSGSEINVLQENFENEESMLPHREGWEKGLVELEQFLNKEDSSTNSKAAEDGGATAENGGYREDPDQVKVGGG
jgi:uncharacterized protein YndB with AHSA1/START domain